MAGGGDGWRPGRRIAPAPFLVFIGMFAAGLVGLVPIASWGRGVMAAFDLAAIAFLAKAAALLDRDAARMRAAAPENDANRTGLLVVTGLVMLVILAAVAGELKGRDDVVAVGFAVATLALAWLFSNTVYALHYAHLYYSAEDGRDAGGLDFPKCREPLYWEFVYFAFTLGMTFQTSDVPITTRAMRRAAIGHCLAAFVFNLGVLAFSVNILGGARG